MSETVLAYVAGVATPFVLAIVGVVLHDATRRGGLERECMRCHVKWGNVHDRRTWILGVNVAAWWHFNVSRAHHRTVRGGA